MTETEATAALIASVDRLSDRMVTLVERLDVSARQAARTRLLSWALSLVVVIGVTLGGWQWVTLSNLTKDNASNATRACENANQDRSANMALWEFILSANDAEPDEVAVRDALREWTRTLYAPHDCTDLDRVYEIPAPPTLG
jgi:hypothetical protein